MFERVARLEGGTDAGDDLLGALEDGCADRVGVATDRARQRGGFGDDVSTEAASDLTNGENRRLGRSD